MEKGIMEDIRRVQSKGRTFNEIPKRNKKEED